MRHTVFRFRPLNSREFRARERRSSPFRASWSSTMELLDEEMRMIAATHAVIEIDLEESEIRRDGLPRAHATPRSPMVRISFETGELGALQYPCDTFDDWRANVRAIAMTMKALRAIDRYGASQQNQQYTGWKALPETASTGSAMITLARLAGMDVATAESDPRSAYRAAARRTHPDAGGNEADFQRLQDARKALGI